MTQLIIAKNILGLFPYQEKIIPKNFILEIKPDRIIIKDLDQKVPVLQPQQSPAS